MIPDDCLAQDQVNILLVDDQPANLMALAAVLADLGQNLVQANSGDQALRCLLDTDFAVVLLDVQMGDLDGFETARLIRGRERSRHTPIIFLTAYDDPSFSAEEAYGLGAVDFLVKPLVPAILRAKVAVFVELFQKAQQIERQAVRLAQAQEERAERRALAQYTAAGLLAASPDLGTAVPKLLRVVGENLGWDAGGLWTVDRNAGVLHCVAFWSGPNAEASAFERDSRGRSIAPGEGLLGRVWVTGEPSWVEDVAQEASFSRASQAASMGLSGASVLPIRIGEEVLGVLEYFSCEIRPPDPGLLRAMEAIASQIGQSLERRRAEEALRRSEARKAAILEAALDAVVTIDHEGRIIDFNPAAERIFGYSQAEALGKAMPELIIPPSLRGRAYHGLSHFRATGEGPILGQRIEMSALRADGTEFPIELAIARIVGDPPLFTAYLRDITDRKALEDELRQRARELAEANQRKDQFLAVLAHELRNPLAPVVNGLHLLRLANGDPQTREKARDIMERQVRHLTRLVDDLLDVSRITRGKVELRREVLDLAPLIRAAAEDRRATLAQAGVQLSLEIPETPLWVVGDATRLTQVLNNLLDNAAKFKDGGDQVTVRLAVDTKECQAVLLVEDNGVGIESELLPRLFDTFAQADRSLDRPRGGLGLGLALVKGLIDLHGGKVRAASRGPGQGAEFSIRLPLKQEGPALAETPTVPPPARAMLRILVVEDNRDAAESLRMLLNLMGHEVQMAHTGPDGVRLADEWHPDLVLCDIGLPGLDGYGVANALRKSPATARTPLIAITGYGQEEDRWRTQQAGFDQHLTKPVDPADLQRVLADQTAATKK